MSDKIRTLADAIDQLYWTCKYAHLGAVANKDENAGLLAAIENMADRVNMMVYEIEQENDKQM